MSDQTEDVSRWIMVYPPYLDARKTVAEGRKIAKLEVFPACSRRLLTFRHAMAQQQAKLRKRANSSTLSAN